MMLVREEWQPLGCLVASPILCSIMPTLDPLRDKSKGLIVFFALGFGCCKGALTNSSGEPLVSPE